MIRRFSQAVHQFGAGRLTEDLVGLLTNPHFKF